MSKRIIIALLLVSGYASCQDWESISPESVKADLTRLSSDLRGQNYVLGFERNVYGHYTDTTPTVSEKGRFVRGSGNEYLSDQASQLIIQNADVKMVIDSSLSTIVLMRPDSLFLPIDMNVFNGVWTDYTFRTIKKDGYRVLDMAPVTEGYGKHSMQLWLRANGSLAKVIIYLPRGNYQQQTMDDETEELPMVVMTYDEKQSITDKQLFTLSAWLIKKGGTYELEPRLAERYTLRDLRYTPPKN